MQFMCWIPHPEGMVLIDEQAKPRGLLIEYPIQREVEIQKRLYEPTRWFKMDGHKSIGKPPDREERKGA